MKQSMERNAALTVCETAASTDKRNWDQKTKKAKTMFRKNCFILFLFH